MNKNIIKKKSTAQDIIRIMLSWVFNSILYPPVEVSDQTAHRIFNGAVHHAYAKCASCRIEKHSFSKSQQRLIWATNSGRDFSSRHSWDDASFRKKKKNTWIYDPTSQELQRATFQPNRRLSVISNRSYAKRLLYPWKSILLEK